MLSKPSPTAFQDDCPQVLHNDDGENFLMLLDGTKSVPWIFFLARKKGLQNAGVDAKIFLARGENWLFEGD